MTAAHLLTDINVHNRELPFNSAWTYFMYGMLLFDMFPNVCITFCMYNA